MGELEKVARALAEASGLDWNDIPERRHKDCPPTMPHVHRAWWRSLAAAAIAAIDEARGWRPIESAPRDGTRILLSDRQRVQEVWWARDYEDGLGYWSTPFGPAGRGYTIIDRPSLLWQPLPAPPKEVA